MRTSRIRQPGRSNMSASSNSRVEAKLADWKPADRINSDRASRTDVSSSTMMTSGCSASLVCGGDNGADLRRDGWSTLMLILHFSVAQGVADGRKQDLCIER